MEEGRGQVEEGKIHVTESGESFENILRMIQNVSSNTERVVATMGTLTEGVQGIVNATAEIEQSAKKVSSEAETVSAATEEQSASMEEIAASTRSLAAMSESLRAAVEKFRV